jgi:DNA helicase-2/ATP-dependent DNA helicase PcrA
VNLLTLHRAKGLEFEAVFLPRVEEGELPFKRARTDEGIAEERRLFYVGITRAKQHLAITCVNDGRRKSSSFFDELSGTPARRSAPSAQAKEPEGVAAEIGMEVELSGGFSGKVIELDERSASVELADGQLLVVRYGERVKTGGVSLPLAPPKGPQERLVDELKKWRLERSKADGVPAYVVFHDATLESIAERRPASLPELSRIDGLGPVKLERYGEEVLGILSES